MKYLSIGLALICGALTGCGGIGSPYISNFPHRCVLSDGPWKPVGGEFIPDCVIALSPVQIPSHLRRPQIVTRDDLGRLHIHDLWRWGEPLDEAIGAVLRRHLEQQLPNDLVLNAPRDRKMRPHFALRISIDDYIAGVRDVHLRARCEFWDCGADVLVGVRRFDGTAGIGGGTPPEGIFEGMRILLTQFGDAIAGDLRHIQDGRLDVLLAPVAAEFPPSATAEEEKSGEKDAPEPVPEAQNRHFPADLLLEADAAVYVTIDDAVTGERIFSRKFQPGQRMVLPCDHPVRIFASDPANLRVDGCPLPSANLSAK